MHQPPVITTLCRVPHAPSTGRPRCRRCCRVLTFSQQPSLSQLPYIKSPAVPTAASPSQVGRDPVSRLFIMGLETDGSVEATALEALGDPHNSPLDYMGRNASRALHQGNIASQEPLSLSTYDFGSAAAVSSVAAVR